MKEVFDEIKPVLTTGWFDTNDEYLEHRRKVKTKLHVSARADGKYEETAGLMAYESYKDLGGAKGGLILGGPDAFDSTSKGGMEELKHSLAGEELEKLIDDSGNVKKTLG